MNPTRDDSGTGGRATVCGCDGTGGGVTFGQQLRRYRKAARLTTTALAEASMVSRSYISELENGHATAPGISVVFNLATVLGVTPDMLMDTSPAPVACRHGAIQWQAEYTTVECLSCGETWEIRS